ncbi:hypothetical protein HA050_14685 [Iodobacter sp. HSC-16F04]|uniref:Uncharacterized protein n=1 Tax=Iodobacter violaceini TaxID=3044271 RepID=A0ABX0KY75_9NEIS|nr:hypothetical protein [Iodobacter violacea]NHQ87360.1 hypothetical protein [Iodobacter violacea]
MNIVIRLLKEFWFPAAIAIVWTIYNVQTSSAPWEFKTILNVFAPTFFLVSWATGQFFRVQKQAQVERNLISIEGRVETLVSRLEKHTQDFFGYTTGANSVAYFIPMLTGNNALELGLINKSTYPVFDVHAEVIDLDEPIDPDKGKLWTRYRFSRASLYPSKIVMGAYHFDLSERQRLNINIFIQTRSLGLMQQLRVIKTEAGILIASRTAAGEQIIEMNVPPDFPGADPNNPNATFE